MKRSSTVQHANLPRVAAWSFWCGDALFIDQYIRVGPTATPSDEVALCDRCRAAFPAGVPRVLWRRMMPGVFPPLALLCAACDTACAAYPTEPIPSKRKRAPPRD